MTDSQNEFLSVPQDSYNFRGEYSRAVFDRRHVLSVNYIYELPFFRNQENLKGKFLGGWQISGITSYFTGIGFSPATSSYDPAGIGFLVSGPATASQRPDVLCDP